MSCTISSTVFVDHDFKHSRTVHMLTLPNRIRINAAMVVLMTQQGPEGYQ